MYDTSFDWDKLATAITELKKYEFKDSELSPLGDLSTYLTGVSNNHCGYLGETCTTLDPSVGDGMAAYLKNTNNAYNGFIAKLENAYSRRNVDEDGGVGGYSGTSGYSGSTGYSGGGDYGGGSYSSGTGTPSTGDLTEVSTGVGQPSLEEVETPQRREVSPESPSTTTPTTSPGDSGTTPGTTPGATTPVTTTPSVAALGAAGAVGGAVVGAALGDVGGLGGSETVGALNPVNYAMGNYAVSENFNDSFTDDEKASITSILEENGYSKDEIEAILNGGYDTSQVLMDNMSDTLAEVVRNNPELRNEIIEKYGFDIFNADGSVNKDKLSMALYIDDMSGRDGYSMISLLSDHGVHLVDQNMFNSYSKEFEKLVLNDYSIKGKIVDKYGFDIFNADGTINKDRLTLAMLIDSKRNDGTSLATIINDSVSGDITSALNTNIRSANLVTGGKKTDKSGFTPVAAVLAAGGAAAGIGVTTHLVRKKNKEENGEEPEEEKKVTFINKDDLDDDGDEGSDWMSDVIKE